MDFVHECPFCGWRREAVSPTILVPECPACGCMLRSVRHGAAEPAPVVAPAPAAPHPGSPRLARVFGRAAAIVFMVAAAKAGWEAGGAWVALGGAALMGLMTVPLLAPDG